MKKPTLLIIFLIPLFLFAQQSNSVLSSGDWYKIAVEQTGVYKVTYSELAGYGIDVGQIDPRNIALFGHPSGMLPEDYDETIFTDLREMAIQVVGEADGSFDTDDYILFFGQSPVTWTYDPADGHYHHQVNYYTDRTCYFLTVGQVPAKRIQLQPNSPLSYTGIINQYDYLIYHENEAVNPGKSGKAWLGESFQEQQTLSFTYDLSPLLVFPSSAYLKTSLAALSTDTNVVEIQINEEPLSTFNLPRVNPSFYANYRFRQSDTMGFTVANQFSISFSYTSSDDSARAWLDYFELQLKIGPYFGGDQFAFRTGENIGVDSVSYFYFNYAQAEALKVWNVSDPLNVAMMDVQLDENDIPWFKTETPQRMEFYGFNGNSYYQAAFAGQVENQNLHAAEVPENIIVTHPKFLVAAQQLAEFHRQEDDMTTGVFTTEQIYNEFSAGNRDVSAIRNFIWYLYDEAGAGESPKYVTLFGDASYDYKDRVSGNTNYVPTYESYESGNAVQSFATDRYFVVKNMFDQGEQPQLAAGRVPVATEAGASQMIDKIQHYAGNSSLGPWKNEMMFIGDDMDVGTHTRQAEYLANKADSTYPVMNFTKCYLDFFELMETGEGPRYPEANETINNKVNDGVFYVNYTGHGGPENLAAEKVVTKEDVAGWSNSDHLPLWVIASSEVARYDDPANVSLGESMFLAHNAGAIAMISNSRAAFSSSNLVMNQSVTEKFSDESLQGSLRIGDLSIFPSLDYNALKWLLIGDPALKVPFPEFKVNTLTVNGVPPAETTDTILPGSTLLITGQITGRDGGNLQSFFNGTVYLKVFAPPYLRSTLGNAGQEVDEFQVQDSILAKTSAMVVQGEFEMEVYLPAQYYEPYGNLKLSWYADNGETDAAGFNDALFYGGAPDGIEEDKFLDMISVYPTAFTDYLFVEIPANTDRTVNYSIYSTTGNLLYSFEKESSDARTRLRVPDLPDGMYILKVNTEKGTRNFKVFKV